MWMAPPPKNRQGKRGIFNKEINVNLLKLNVRVFNNSDPGIRISNRGACLTVPQKAEAQDFL